MEPEPVGAAPSAVAGAPLSFALFIQSRTLHAFGAEMLSALGLHPGQELVIMQLLDRDGQTQSDLQRSLGLDHSTVSRTIRRMEEAGLLSRERHDEDRRAMVVRLTPAGRALRAPLAAVWSALESAVLAGLRGRAQRDEILEVTQAVTTALRDSRQRNRERPSS